MQMYRLQYLIKQCLIKLLLVVSLLKFIFRNYDWEGHVLFVFACMCPKS